MGDTKIEWAEKTWSPVTGCTKVSEGCQHCYAERMSKRLRGRYGYPQDQPFWVTLHEDRLEQPLHWRKPRMVFACSMGDLFHEDVPDTFIADVWTTMMNASWHQFLVLTKRPQRMETWLRECSPLWQPANLPDIPLPNVGLGVSVEDNAHLDRLEVLIKTAAAMRFVSFEPLLGPVDASLYLPGLDWIIVGGESGPKARPMRPDWVRGLRDQAVEASVPFLFKQWGAFVGGAATEMLEQDGEQVPGWCLYQNHDWSTCCDKDWGNGVVSMRVGKKKAGRLLDGRTWDESPRG